MRYTINNIPGEIDWEIRGERNRRIVMNCKNLLCTRRGEVPYDRRRGFNPALYDLPLNQLSQVLLPEIDRVLLWEKNAEAVSARAENVDGVTVITCIIEVT